MNIKVTVFFVAAFGLAQAFHKLVPNDKELVYKYKAEITAGTEVPVSFGSQFLLEGFLHVQPGTNSTYVRFSDLKYKIYNGEFDHHLDDVEGLTSVLLPSETEDLLHVFKVVYDDSGNAIGISTESQEKMFSRNIKKAIASILQMDVDHVNLEVQKPHAYVTEEQSIYGKGKMLYNVLPHDDFVIVQKMHEMATTRHLYHYTLTNMEPLFCEQPYEDPLSHDSQRKYLIVKHEGHHIVKHMEANGGIYFYPLKGKSEAQYVYVNQTFHLTEVIPIQKRYQVNAEHYEDDLSYYLADLSIETGASPDLTNGRRPVDMLKLEPIVYKMLDEILEYLHEDHIHIGTPNIKNGQLINRLRRVLVLIDLPTMEKIYNNLVLKHTEHDLKILDVFHHILPLVGSKAAAIHIKNLVVHNKVKGEIAAQMLFNLPLNIKVASESFLADMKELINLPTTTSWFIRKTAILSFASLVHKVAEMEKRLHQSHGHYDDHHDAPHRDFEAPYEIYVTDFVNKMKASQNYDEQMLYLEALFNMKFQSIIKHLEPAVNGELWKCHHKRLMAMWAISQPIMLHPEKVFELFWPIFTNHHEHSELRMIAYYLIMESRPSVSRLLNIFWYMYTEHDEEFQHFHYTYWHTLSKTTDPCKSRTRLHLAQLFKYMHKPLHGYSRYHQIDYKDIKYGFGGGYSGFWMNANTSKLFYFGMNKQIFNVPTDEYMFYAKVHGLDHSLSEKLTFNVDSATKLFNYNELFEAITSIQNNKNIRIEIAILKQTHVISSLYYDGTNIKDLTSFFNYFTAAHHSYIKKTIHMNYFMFTKVLMPTELGIPAVLDMLVPTVQLTEFNITKDVTETKIRNYHLDNHLKTWMHSLYGLSFYNSFVDVWQGINKYHSYDSVTPLYADITINPQQQNMKISFKRHADIKKDVLGFRSHAATMVFVQDDLHKDILISSCKDCQNWVYVSRGEKYRHDYDLLNKEYYETGNHRHVAVYDSENYVSSKTADAIAHKLSLSYDKNFETPIGYFLLYIRHTIFYIWLHPQPGMGGVISKITPSTVTPVTNIDLSLRFNHEINHDEFLFNPNMKLSARATYVLKNDDKALRTWDVNTILNFNDGHTNNNLKTEITRIIPGQKDFKMCIDGNKKWTHDGVSGHVNIALGQTDDGKCSKDNANIDITMTGMKSIEQKEEYHVYGDCVFPNTYESQNHHPIPCLMAHTTVRDYFYDIKTTNVAIALKKLLYQWFDVIKSHYMPYYNYINEHTEDVEENNLKVKVHYPTVGNQVDLHVLTPQHGYIFSGVPIHDLSLIGLKPDNLHYSKLFNFMHVVGLTTECHFDSDRIVVNHHSVMEQIPNEWTMFVGDTAQDPKHAVYVKTVEGKTLAMKIVHKSHVLEVVPQGHAVSITVDGKKLVTNDHMEHIDDWVNLKIYGGSIQSASIVVPYFGLHIEYEDHDVFMEIPKLSSHLFGRCVEHHH